MNISISHAKPEDVKEIQQVFYRTWLDTYPNKEAGITVDDIRHKYKDRLSDEGLKERAERLKSMPAEEKFLVAKEDGVVVGVCGVVVHKDKNQLRAIYVLPEHQRKGIGGMLWKEALKYLDSTKETVIEVVTYNTKAIEFYKKLGFVDTGRRFSDERFRMKSGAILPEMEMVLKV